MDGKYRQQGDFNMNNGTEIKIFKADGEMKIEVKGHHKDPRVCAGISAIMQTCELGLLAIANSSEKVNILEFK